MVAVARQTAGENQDEESSTKPYVSQRCVFESKMEEP
jgi:hypothetical protein